MSHAQPGAVDRLSLRSLLRGSTLVFSARLIGAIATFATQVLLARWLGAEELGVYVVAFSLTMLLGAMGHLGFATAAVRFVPGAQARNDAGALRGFLRSSCAAVALGSMLFCLLGVGGALLFDTLEPTTRHVPFIVASLMVPLMAFMHFFGGMANGFGWIASAFIPSNVVRPLLAMAAIAVVWQLGSAPNAVSVLLIQAGALALCVLGLGLLIRVRTAPLAAIEPEYRTGLWMRTALPLLAVGLFVHYFPDATLLLLGAYLPSDEVGIFNAAYRLALLIAFGLAAVDARFTPSAAGLHARGDHATLRRLTFRVTRLRLLGALLAVALLAVFGRQALGIFGEAFKVGYVVLVLLAIAQLVQAAAGPATALLSATGHQRHCVRVFGWALGGIAVLLTCLVPPFGIEGAAVSILLVTLGWSIWLHSLVRLHLGMRLFPFALLR